MIGELEKYFNDQYPMVTEVLLSQLNPNYFYHNLRHTLDVIDNTQIIGKAEGLDEVDLMILKIAALFHDTGFLKQRKHHEAAGVEYFMRHIDNQLSPALIQQISDCILATQMPQQPKNLLECVICDADLDYLGRLDFEEIGQALFAEMKHCDEIKTSEEWDVLQVKFLQNHSFHTNYSKLNREPIKQQHLAKLELKSR
jgi:predicted metal-dependent HD superfamily phosphohydrolase